MNTLFTPVPYLLTKLLTHFVPIKVLSVNVLLRLYKQRRSFHTFIDALVQESSNFIANVLELLQSCARPSMILRFYTMKLRLRFVSRGHDSAAW